MFRYIVVTELSVRLLFDAAKLWSVTPSSDTELSVSDVSVYSEVESELLSLNKGFLIAVFEPGAFSSCDLGENDDYSS